MNEFGELRLKFTSSEPLKYGANAAAEFDEPDWPRFVRITDVDEHGRLRDDTFRSLPPEIAKPYELQEGDLLLARSGATVGKSFIYEKDWGAACYAGYLIRLRVSKKFDARYLYWYFQSGKYWADINSNLIQSTIQNVSADRYANFRIPTPLLETQRRIAKFLDAKTARIDALIERKRALLDRLAEKRQALITHAVTKGLDPAAPMKDSGIDWLGQVPTHWELKRLSSFCGFQSGKAHEPFIEPDGQFVCVNARFISTDTAVEKRCTQNLVPTKLGDILMVMSDLPNGRALARSFLVDDRDQYAVNQRVCRIRPLQGISAYFSYQLNRNPQLLRNDDGKEQTHLSNSDFKLVLLLQPPEDEQRNIVDYVDYVATSIEAKATLVETSVNSLEEYRAALITAAVTGQLDLEAA